MIEEKYEPSKLALANSAKEDYERLKEIDPELAEELKSHRFWQNSDIIIEDDSKSMRSKTEILKSRYTSKEK